jgi:adhesin/invasin
MYILDFGNSRIRRVDHRTGIITTVAGSGVYGPGPPSGPAADAGFEYVGSLAVAPNGEVYFSDARLDTVRRLDHLSGTFTTVAGEHPGVAIPPVYNGDGIAALQVSLIFPFHITVDCTGNLTISDTFNFKVRQVDSHNGTITTIAGDGISGYSGDDGLAIQAALSQPKGIGFSRDGSLYVVDSYRVRRVSGFTGTRNWDCRDENRYHGGERFEWGKDSGADAQW